MVQLAGAGEAERVRYAGGLRRCLKRLEVLNRKGNSGTQPGRSRAWQGSNAFEMTR